MGKLNPPLEHTKKDIITNILIISFMSEDYFKINSCNCRFLLVRKTKRSCQSGGRSHPLHALLLNPLTVLHSPQFPFLQAAFGSQCPHRQHNGEAMPTHRHCRDCTRTAGHQQMGLSRGIQEFLCLEAQRAWRWSQGHEIGCVRSQALYVQEQQIFKFIKTVTEEGVLK